MKKIQKLDEIRLISLYRRYTKYILDRYKLKVS